MTREDAPVHLAYQCEHFCRLGVARCVVEQGSTIVSGVGSVSSLVSSLKLCQDLGLELVEIDRDAYEQMVAAGVAPVEPPAEINIRD